MNENTRQERTDILSTVVAVCLGLIGVLFVFRDLILMWLG